MLHGVLNLLTSGIRRVQGQTGNAVWKNIQKKVFGDETLIGLQWHTSGKKRERIKNVELLRRPH